MIYLRVNILYFGMGEILLSMLYFILIHLSRTLSYYWDVMVIINKL
jgi:hypothetical protein